MQYTFFYFHVIKLLTLQHKMAFFFRGVRRVGEAEFNNMSGELCDIPGKCHICGKCHGKKYVNVYDANSKKKTAGPHSKSIKCPSCNGSGKVKAGTQLV